MKQEAEQGARQSAAAEPQAEDEAEAGEDEDEAEEGKVRGGCYSLLAGASLLHEWTDISVAS